MSQNDNSNTLVTVIPNADGKLISLGIANIINERELKIIEEFKSLDSKIYFTEQMCDQGRQLRVRLKGIDKTQLPSEGNQPLLYNALQSQL